MNIWHYFIAIGIFCGSFAVWHIATHGFGTMIFVLPLAAFLIWRGAAAARKFGSR
jgi:hypothetical protein